VAKSEKTGNRREFLKETVAYGGALGAISLLPWTADSEVLGAGATADAPAGFEPVSAHVRVYHDVVSVGVIEKNGKIILIDSGEGEVLSALKQRQSARIDWVLYTHHHRDQCSGAARLKKAGAKIAVPAAEAKLFRGATEFWRDADNVIDHRYKFRPDMFVLRESVAPDRELEPGDVVEWEGLKIQVVPAPGHTDGSVSYLVDIDGQRVTFTGDLIYGPGQLWELYSLQKGLPGMPFDYSGFGGASGEVLNSLDQLLSRQPTCFVPSHGMVMRNPKGAVDLLRQNLNAAMNNYLAFTSWRNVAGFKNVKWGINIPMLPPLPAVPLPAWLHHVDFHHSTSYYIQAPDRSIFLFDAGFWPCSDKMVSLAQTGEITGIDGIWISHYHDDHVESVNDLRRRFGAKVYAQREIQDILENPRAYLMPCLFPESIRVDHPLSEGEVIEWRGYKLTAYYFPGQTLYHDGLLVEHQGTRIFMSGDSFSNFGMDDYCSFNRNLLGEDRGFDRCLHLLKRLQPDLLVAAHYGPVPVSQAYLDKALDALSEREVLMRKLLPWDDPNFGLDPYWIRTYPYRQSILPGQQATLEAIILNHSDEPRVATVTLRVPTGWKAMPGAPLRISAHREGRIRLEAVAPLEPTQRREVLGLAVQFGSRNLGEFAEAIVDYLR
jgi:glyoxylase-like metal-dependent hydrolase (beta-lactamase superfamily II)